MGILHEDVVVISQAEKAGEPTTSTSPSTLAIDASSSNPMLGSQSERREGMLRSSAIGGRLAVWEGDFWNELSWPVTSPTVDTSTFNV
ncbi:unnamed protein product [Prunus armeniaca]|uniref:Uncharacterized protein n=1 Tax=Prunus armeniaca TaxID=36596 RepID=A0A6J5WJJ6_PRUAR|nr:unnamed protein product [Prunus armeniaca]